MSNRNGLFLRGFFPILFAVNVFGQDEVRPLQFEKKQVWVGAKKLNVEIADTPIKRQRGLMYRKELKENEGMLFIFQEEKIRTFFMKNTYIPLSIGYFNKKKKLVDIQKMNPPSSLFSKKIPQSTSRFPAQYVLEVSQGWFKRNRMKVGSLLKTKSP